MNGKKRIINIILPLVALGVMVFYTSCKSSCSFLSGTLAGIDLKYLGFVYPAVLCVPALLKQKNLFLAGASFGVGAEINLIAFQIIHNVYCPYCLTVAAIIVFLFAFNFNWSKKVVIGLSIIVGFLLFFLFFSGMTVPAYAEQELFLPSFGNGKVQVRLYTGYFCPPCEKAEPTIEPLIKELVKKNKISLTFIDLPSHNPSTLLIRYFIYAMNYNKSFDSIMLARNVLFGAAKLKIEDKNKLEAYLKKNGVKFTIVKPEPYYEAYKALSQEDKIGETPTCVIIDQGRKSLITGVTGVPKALDLLR